MKEKTLDSGSISVTSWHDGYSVPGRWKPDIVGKYLWRAWRRIFQCFYIGSYSYTRKTLAMVLARYCFVSVSDVFSFLSTSAVRHKKCQSIWSGMPQNNVNRAGKFGWVLDDNETHESAVTINAQQTKLEFVSLSKNIQPSVPDFITHAYL